MTTKVSKEVRELSRGTKVERPVIAELGLEKWLQDFSADEKNNKILIVGDFGCSETARVLEAVDEALRSVPEPRTYAVIYETHGKRTKIGRLGQKTKMVHVLISEDIANKITGLTADSMVHNIGIIKKNKKIK